MLLQNALLESEQFRYVVLLLSLSLVPEDCVSRESIRYNASTEPHWFSPSVFPVNDQERVVIEVGGKLFEISTRTAAKDPGSLLAAFANDQCSPIQPSSGQEGIFRVKRDWCVVKRGEPLYLIRVSLMQSFLYL